MNYITAMKEIDSLKNDLVIDKEETNSYIEYHKKEKYIAAIDYLRSKSYEDSILLDKFIEYILDNIQPDELCPNKDNKNKMCKLECSECLIRYFKNKAEFKINRGVDFVPEKRGPKVKNKEE